MPLSASPPHGVTVLQAVILTALAVVMMFAGLALAGVAGLAVGQGSGSVAVEASAMAMGQLFGFGGAAAAAVLWLRHGISWQEFLSVWPVRPRTVAFAVIAGAAYQFPLAEISNAAQEWWPVPLAKQELMARLLSPGSVVELLAVVAAIVLVAPLTEEVLFRGVLLGGLDRRYGAFIAIPLSAALFGLCHFVPSAVVYATAAGLLLGWIGLRVGSIAVTVVMHAAVNATPIFLQESWMPIRGFNVPTEGVHHLSPTLLIATTLVALGATVLLLRSEPQSLSHRHGQEQP
ncbi:MAG: CPBP family intramembrane metalloprotease [Myxococcales bacterium]|nr:CPBP family intramembrane metalloprotease [Myxococcales bacterium]